MDDSQTPRQDALSNTPRRGGPVHARSSPRAWIMLMVFIAAGLAVDLISKQLAFEHVHDWPIELDRQELLSDHGHDPTINTRRVNLLPGDLIGLRLAINRGAVLGVGSNQRGFFLIFTIAALLGGMYVFSTKTRARHGWAHLGIGLLLAGALGNFYDRLALGAVRDFIQFLPGRLLPYGWKWPGNNPELMPWVFNVADVLLVVGVAILMLHVRKKRTARKARKMEAAAAAA